MVAEVEESRGSLLLGGLRKFSRYWLAVQAVNQEGAGPLSEPVAAATLEDGQCAPQQIVSVGALANWQI